MENKKKYVLIILIILNIYSNPSVAQISKKYKKEYCKFIKFIRNDMIDNLGYRNLSLQNDSINLLEFTSNDKLFLGVPFYGNIATNDLISEKDKIDILKKIYQDSNKIKIEINCIEKCYLLPEIIAKKMNSIIYQFSNPVFDKKYTICFFCIKTLNQDYSSQNSYLYQKRQGSWYLVKKIGGISDY